MASPGTGVEVIRGPERASLVLQRTRRDLLARLAEPDSAAGLARKLGLPRQRLNYHLHELEREGLVACVEERRKGNCTERILRATARTFVISPEALGALGATPDTARDRLSSGYLLATAAQAIRDVSMLDARARGEGKRLATLTLDAQIRFASASARAAFAEELTAMLAQLVARHHDDSTPGGRRFRLVAIVHPAAAEPHPTETEIPAESAGARPARSKAARSRRRPTPRR